MSHDSLPSLDAPGLLLRPLATQDEAVYCRLYTDARVMRHIAAPMSPDAAQRGFRAALRLQGGKRMYWLLLPDHGGDAFGILALVVEGATAEVGVMLFAEGQGRGIATRAIASVAGWLFEQGRVLTLWTRHSCANPAAIGLMETLGFQPVVAADAPTGEHRWEMTRDRWYERRAPVAAASVIG